MIILKRLEPEYLPIMHLEKTAGQARYPTSKIAARAIPDGIHTGDALVPSNAKIKPSFAVK